MHGHAIGTGGASQGTFRSYLAGFVLAVGLTLVAFGLVMTGALSRPMTIAAIFTAAVVQILVHLHYFLHLDRSPEQRWNVFALAFTAMVILIIVGGSVWIMFNLHARTMLG